MDATPIFIFDKNENLQTILRVEGDSLPYYSTNYKDQLFNAATTVQSQAENSLSFSLPANDPNSSYIVDGALAAFKDLDGKFKMFEIRILDDSHNAELYKEAYGVNIGQTELNDEFIENLVMTDVDNNKALVDVLKGTDWRVGTVAALGTNSLNLQRYNVLNALAQLVQTWGGEIVFRVEITDNKITGRYIDWLDRTGTNTGKRFEYGKDINSIQKTTDTSNLKTALYGYGQADSNGNRLTFGDIVWSVANGDPVDKPQGQTWVGDPNGLIAWGRKNGTKHRFGEYDASNITDATALLNATWANVQNVETPLISYHMSVITLEEITGLSHEAIRNGDTVKAIDSEFSPALRLEARILEYDRDLINPYNSSVVLGNFLPTLATNQSQLKTVQRTINDNAGKWDTAASEANNPTITDANFPDTTPGVPGNLTADGGFKTIMLNWDYDTSAYIAAYEVYASQTSGFTPDSTTLIWRGKAGSYVLDANTNQQWYFEIRAINTHGTAGPYTTQISAQTVQVQNIDIDIGAVNSQILADSSVIAAKLASGSVSTAALQNGSVGTSALADVGVTTGKMADLAVVAGKLANGAVGTAQIQSAAITSALITDGTITTADIGSAQITSALMASAAIGTAAIQNLAVTNSKIANATIDTAKIANAAITSALIRSAAVGTAAIANAGITNAKIASAAIGSAQLQDAIITNAKIANAAIDDAKISNVDASKITTGLLDAARIAAGAITSDKISVTDLSAISENVGTITAGTLNGVTMNGSSFNTTGQYGPHISIHDNVIQVNSDNVYLDNYNITGSKALTTSTYLYKRSDGVTDRYYDGTSMDYNGINITDAFKTNVTNTYDPMNPNFTGPDDASEWTTWNRVVLNYQGITFETGTTNVNESTIFSDGNGITVSAGRTTFDSQITFSDRLLLAAGFGIDSTYNNGYVLNDHNNGNISLSAVGGSLFLGYINTTQVNVNAPVVSSFESQWKTTQNSGYATTGATGSTGGYWTMIGQVSFTAQYQDAAAVIDFMGIGTTADSASGRIILRVKQQSAMGNNPAMYVKLANGSNFSASMVKAVLATKSSRSTIVQLWVENNIAYQTLVFNPTLSYGVDYFEKQSLQSAAPGGWTSVTATAI